MLVSDPEGQHDLMKSLMVKLRDFDDKGLDHRPEPTKPIARMVSDMNMSQKITERDNSLNSRDNGLNKSQTNVNSKRESMRREDIGASIRKSIDAQKSGTQNIIGL